MTHPIDLHTAALLPATLASAASGDAWQRRFGVPWERVERAVRAVSDRAVAASRRKFATAPESAPARTDIRHG